MKPLMRLEILFGQLAIVKQDVNDLFYLRVAVSAEHDSVQRCVSILTLGVDVCAFFDQLLDDFEISGNDSFV